MRPVSRLSLVTLTVSLLAVLHAPAGIAAGATLYVKASGSDFLTSCTAADPCRTIKRAVSVADPGDTIQVGPGTFDEPGGVVIGKSLTIAGSGWFSTRVRLDEALSPGGVCHCPVFTIGEGANVTLTGMTISGGNGATAGGIYNQGSLTLQYASISDNHAGAGSGIANEGSLAMTNVDLDHNEGLSGLENYGTADVFNSEITGTYGFGGYSIGVANRGGTLVVNRGLVARNQGAGVAASVGPAGKDCPTTVLTNVTVSGNSNGGVSATGGPNCPTMTLTHVTIAANTSADLAGGLHVTAGTPVVLNSIVATNSDPQCDFTGPIASISISRSLLGDSSCLAWPAPYNLIGVAPKLSALSYHGGNLGFLLLGASEVQALLPGSPAIDSAGDAYCTPTDQLGLPRPVDGNGDGVARCDMGAFEYQPPGGGGTR
jgi:hypothetical protein